MRRYHIIYGKDNWRIFFMWPIRRYSIYTLYKLYIIIYNSLLFALQTFSCSSTTLKALVRSLIPQFEGKVNGIKNASKVNITFTFYQQSIQKNARPGNLKTLYISFIGFLKSDVQSFKISWPCIIFEWIVDRKWK